MLFILSIYPHLPEPLCICSWYTLLILPILLHFDTEDAVSKPHIERGYNLRALLPDEMHPKPFYQIMYAHISDKIQDKDSLWNKSSV